MDAVLNNGFCELTRDEAEMLDGGFAITITAALITAGVALFTGGFAAGIAVGLNRKNREMAAEGSR